MLVMVPLDDQQRRLIADAQPIPGPLFAIAADDALAETFGVEPGEEAEAAALQMADVAGLAGAYGAGDRLVIVVAEATATVAPDEADNGGVYIDGLTAADVAAFFTGQGAVPEARGLSLDAAWDLPGVQELLGSQPLSWHDRTELLTELVQL